MEFIKLKENIFDVIKEEQVKLGYRKEMIRLYYPLKSLNSFLSSKFSTEEMRNALSQFADYMEPEFGRPEISNKGERFCIGLQPQVSEYVYKNTPQEGFLYDFIDAVSNHGTTIDDVLEQFKKYSENVHIEKIDDDEFDYLVYFEDGKPDEYMYCLTDEGCHVIYHRFTKEDYREIFGG